MAPTGPVDRRAGVLPQRVVAVDLDGRTVLAVARQAEVDAGQVGIDQACPGIESGPAVVALGGHGLAAEDVPVEGGQPDPVGPGQVQVAEPGTGDGRLAARWRTGQGGHGAVRERSRSVSSAERGRPARA